MNKTIAKTTRPMRSNRRAKIRNVASLGMVRAAIIDAMQRRKWSKYQLWKATEVPRTIVYSFLGVEDGRDINLRHAEAMMIALGIMPMRVNDTITPVKTKD